MLIYRAIFKTIEWRKSNRFLISKTFAVTIFIATFVYSKKQQINIEL